MVDISREQFFGIAVILIIIYVVFIQTSQQPVAQTGQVPVGNLTNATNTTTNQPIINVEKLDWLPWIIVAGFVIWYLWQKNQQGQKPFIDSLEAKKIIEQEFRKWGIFPIEFVQFDFKDPDTKYEAWGTIICPNQQFSHPNKHIPFEIRKNGHLMFDTTLLWADPLQRRPLPKKGILIQKGGQQQQPKTGEKK